MVVAVDLGFGWTKGAVENKEVTFPSVVGSYRNLIDTSLNNNDAIWNIVAYEENGWYFVGDLAIRQSPFKFFSLKESKPESATTRILLKTAIGLLEPAQDKIKLVSGLPVTFYFSQKDKLERLCKGEHRILLRVGNKEINRVIEVVQTKIVPQPLGSFMDWLLDDLSNIDINKKQVAAGTIGVVDIGFYTTDYLTLRGLEVLSDHSRSSKSGIALALKSLADYGLDLPLYVLDKEIRNGTYTNIKHQIFTALAEQIRQEIETYMPSNLDLIIVTGGGGSILYRYLNLPYSTLVRDPSLSNVKGYLKLGRRSF